MEAGEPVGGVVVCVPVLVAEDAVPVGVTSLDFAPLDAATLDLDEDAVFDVWPLRAADCDPSMPTSPIATMAPTSTNKRSSGRQVETCTG